MKVLSYNIQDGGRARRSLIAAIVLGQDPDAVALIEANDLDSAGLLARDLDMELVVGEVANGHQVVWLSRLPVRHAENHRSPRLAKTLLEIEILSDLDEIVSLFATHPGSRHDVPQPADEIPVILDVMRRPADRPHVLVGDFNALHPDDPVGSPPPGVVKRGDAVDGAPCPAIRQLLTAGYLDAYRVLHPDDPGYTYLADTPWLRLDYVFLSPDLAGRLVAS